MYITGNDNDGYNVNHTGLTMGDYTSVDSEDNYRVLFTTLPNPDYPNTISTGLVARAFYGSNFFSNNWLNNNYGHFSTLAQALTHLAEYFRNCYIFVNGEDWSGFITYQWSSIPAISGKNGILSLATIDDEYLGDGSPVTDGSIAWITNMPNSASFSSLVSNLGVGNADAPIMWSGNTKRCDATFTDVPLIGTSLVLKFYLAPSTGGIENMIFMTGWTGIDYNKSYIGFIKDDENEVAKVSMIRTYWDIDHLNEYVSFNDTGSSTMTDEEMHNLWIWLEGGTSTDTESDGTDTVQDNDPDGGGGFIPRFNNPIPKPHTPGKSALDTGFISLWYMTDAQLNDLSSYLWSDYFFDIIEKRLYNDPMDALISLMIFPVTPPHDDSSHPSTIIFAGKTTTKQGLKIHQQFDTIPMGSVEVTPSLENGVYFDYSPYLSARIYLPFCGEFELDINEVVNKKLSLEYMVDYFTGMCCAYLTINDRTTDDLKGTHYYFTGQMGIKVPVSASDYSGLYNAVVSAGATIGGALAVPTSAIASAPVQIGLMANACNNVANMKSNCQYTSGGGSISGSLSCEYPYIILSEPNIFEAENQWNYVGYPCLSTYKIKKISGYFKVLETHVENIACTETEREQIRNILMSGCVRHSGTSIPSSYTTPETTGNLVILFLKNMSDKNTLGKTFKKKQDETLDCLKTEGRLLENQSIEKPVLIIDGDVTPYNYVYIPAFNRFYYINDMTIKTDTLKFISCEVDALQSFKTEIDELECIISDVGDKKKAKLLANNNAWFMKQNKEVITLTFKDSAKRNMGFERGSGSGESYILAVAGGNEYTP